MQPGLSIVIPTKNEVLNLPWLFESIQQAIPANVPGFECIVVDWPSGDGTEALCNQTDHVTYLKTRKSYGQALIQGIHISKYSLVMTIDADGSHNPRHVASMLEAMVSADVVIGSRYMFGHSHDGNWVRAISSKWLNWYLALRSDVGITDLTSGYRMYQKQLFHGITLKSTGFDIQVEILQNAIAQGKKIIEVPIVYSKRKFGRSKASFFAEGLRLLRVSLMDGYVKTVE